MAQPEKDDMLVRQAKAVRDFNWTGEYTMPGSGLYPHQWSWDSVLIALAYSFYDQDRAVQELGHLFEAQWKRDGQHLRYRWRHNASLRKVMSTRISDGQVSSLRAFLPGLMVVLLTSLMGARSRRSYRLARWHGLGLTGLLAAAAPLIALLRWAYSRIRRESGRSGDQFVPANWSS